MKNTQTILQEVQTLAIADEYEYYADAERSGEISRATYYRACEKAGLPHNKAVACLRENYQRAGLAHLF